jgi:hypothetical protein
MEGDYQPLNMFYHCKSLSLDPLPPSFPRHANSNYVPERNDQGCG